MARLLAAMATLLAVCLVAPQPASASAADPYAPTDIPTEVVIEVDAEITVGDDVVITYEVTANESAGPIEGTLEISGGLRAAALATGGGDSVLASSVQGTALAPNTFSQTHPYDGSPITVNVGAQPIGDYVTTATFTPAAGSSYLPSEGTAQYAVVGDVGGEQSGILPDTGGPGAWWLLLALLLVAGGAGAVYYGRRRSASK